MMMPLNLRARLLAACAVLAMAASSSCGYALAGRGSTLPDYIKTIGVPQFKNATPVFDLDRVITERVRTELIGRGKYRVETAPLGVDAVVDGTITSISYSLATTDQNKQASRYFITITASVSFRDLKTGKELWSNPAVSFRDEYAVANAVSGAEVSAFFGQETEALARLATDFARSVVSAMLEAF
ncbi:MAG: LPS assembly lipoprotein LptE [Acidobacteriota bacterium]|nr:LPS assembly lipoprotein LptE [Acidobacteriota bacterium]